MALRIGRRGQTDSRHKAGYFDARSSRNWINRGALVLIFGIIGYTTTTRSLAQVVAKVDPARAHAMAPNDGVILAEYAKDAFSRSVSITPDSLPARLSREALVSDPTATKALTVLGFQAQLRGDSVQANRIFSYSNALSRRELQPRIWAIEEAVSRGDISSALHNYDIALRTSDEPGVMFYPTLTKAIREPRIRSALLPILAQNPVWEKSFLAYAANSGLEPEGTIALLREGRKIGLEANEQMRSNLINSLVAQNKHDAAWAFYRTFRKGANRDRSRDPRFEQQAVERSVFDWRTATDQRLSVAILRDRNKGLLDFSAPPSVGGELVSQMQLLPAGAYRLEGRSRGIEQPKQSRPYWTLTCQNGRELGRVPLPNSRQSEGHFSGQFVVPEGCSVQTLSLVARPTSDILGINGQIESARLVPE